MNAMSFVLLCCFGAGVIATIIISVRNALQRSKAKQEKEVAELRKLAEEIDAICVRGTWTTPDEDDSSGEYKTTLVYRNKLAMVKAVPFVVMDKLHSNTGEFLVAMQAVRLAPGRVTLHLDFATFCKMKPGDAWRLDYFSFDGKTWWRWLSHEPVLAEE